MKKSYFLTEDNEICWNEDHFQNIMKQEGLTEIEVFKAELMYEKGLFWCSEHSFSGDGTNDYCGKKNGCNEYDPRNGKNGRCRHHKLELYAPGDKIILKYKLKSNYNAEARS